MHPKYRSAFLTAAAMVVLLGVTIGKEDKDGGSNKTLSQIVKNDGTNNPGETDESSIHIFFYWTH